MCVFAPATESIVGNHHVDIMAFYNGFYCFMVIPEISQGFRKRGHQLENLCVRSAVCWLKSWKLDEFQIREGFLKERQWPFIGCNDDLVTLVYQGLDDWYTTSCMT